MRTPKSEKRVEARTADLLSPQEPVRPAVTDQRVSSRLSAASEVASTINEELGSSPAAHYDKDAPLPGVTTWINRNNGFRIVDLEFTADPTKRSDEWLERNKKGIPRREWEREYGRRWTIYEGKPVYQSFDESRHTFNGKIVIADKIRLVSGWDAGPTDVNLAWSLALVNIRKLTVQFVDEYFVDDGDTEDFIQTVLAKFQLDWARFSTTGIHVADQSVFTETRVEQKSFADLLRRFGIFPIPGEISFAKRRASVERLLEQHEAFKVHERCKLIVEALGGGYVYGRLAGGVGGQYKETPLKNEFSHIANTVEYVCSRMGVAAQHIPFEGRPLPRVRII